MKPAEQRRSSLRRTGAGRRLTAVGAGLFFSIVAACTLLNPLDEYGPPRAQPDAGDASDGKASSCARARWPERPAKDDATGDLELVLAVRTFGFAAPADAGAEVTSGFDLDGLCTCPDPPSCSPPPDSGSQCDKEGGIDDHGSTLFTSLAGVARIAGDQSDQVARGEGGLLIRIAHYNGGQNDTQVELSIFHSLGTPQDDASVPKPPQHDGNDEWTVDRTSLFGGGGPPLYLPNFVDTNAYIAGGMIVSQANFPLDVGPLTVNLTGGTVVARLVHQGSLYNLEDGRVVGRFPTAKLLPALDTLIDPLAPDGGGVCGDSLLYADLKRRICAAVDLVSDPAKDSTSAACDALGLTIVFTAETAKFGPVVDPKPLNHLCGPNWSDDCTR